MCPDNACVTFEEGVAIDERKWSVRVGTQWFRWSFATLADTLADALAFCRHHGFTVVHQDEEFADNGH